MISRREEGTTTPFDMVARNDLDRFHLASDVIDRLPKLGYLAAYAKQEVRDELIEHKQYITRYGDDMSEAKQLALARGGRCLVWRGYTGEPRMLAIPLEETRLYYCQGTRVRCRGARRAGCRDRLGRTRR